MYAGAVHCRIYAEQAWQVESGCSAHTEKKGEKKKKKKKKKNNTNKIHAVKNVHKSIAFLGGHVKTLRENICYKNYLSAIVR